MHKIRYASLRLWLVLAVLIFPLSGFACDRNTETDLILLQLANVGDRLMADEQMCITATHSGAPEPALVGRRSFQEHAVDMYFVRLTRKIKVDRVYAANWATNPDPTLFISNKTVQNLGNSDGCAILIDLESKPSDYLSLAVSGANEDVEARPARPVTRVISESSASQSFCYNSDQLGLEFDALPQKLRVARDAEKVNVELKVSNTSNTLKIYSEISHQSLAENAAFEDSLQSIANRWVRLPPLKKGNSNSSLQNARRVRLKAFGTLTGFGALEVLRESTP